LMGSSEQCARSAMPVECAGGFLLR
jgi:hypothetical protein